jgi:hypothetical protein
MGPDSNVQVADHVAPSEIRAPGETLPPMPADLPERSRHYSGADALEYRAVSGWPWVARQEQSLRISGGFHRPRETSFLWHKIRTGLGHQWMNAAYQKIRGSDRAVRCGREGLRERPRPRLNSRRGYWSELWLSDRFRFRRGRCVRGTAVQTELHIHGFDRGQPHLHVPQGPADPCLAKGWPDLSRRLRPRQSLDALSSGPLCRTRHASATFRRRPGPLISLPSERGGDPPQSSSRSLATQGGPGACEAPKTYARQGVAP